MRTEEEIKIRLANSEEIAHDFCGNNEPLIVAKRVLRWVLNEEVK